MQPQAVILRVRNMPAVALATSLPLHRDPQLVVTEVLTPLVPLTQAPTAVQALTDGPVLPTVPPSVLIVVLNRPGAATLFLVRATVSASVLPLPPFTGPLINLPVEVKGAASVLVPVTIQAVLLT